MPNSSLVKTDFSLFEIFQRQELSVGFLLDASPGLPRNLLLLVSVGQINAVN